jgi:hypothetical protein
MGNRSRSRWTLLLQEHWEMASLVPRLSLNVRPALRLNADWSGSLSRQSGTLAAPRVNQGFLGWQRDPPGFPAPTLPSQLGRSLALSLGGHC